MVLNGKEMKNDFKFMWRGADFNSQGDKTVKSDSKRSGLS
jgi:hypothetical protein